MELVLNEEQQLLRESAEKLIRRYAGPRAHRALLDTENGFERDRLVAVAEAGWLSLLVPEARGGLDLGTTEVALVLEEAGRGLMTEPIAAMIASAPALACGSAQTLSVLEEVLAGQTIVLPVLHDPFMDENDDPNLKAKPAGNGFRLTGRTTPVPHAGSAGAYLVNTRAEDGGVLCLVRKEAGGLEINSRTKVDATEHASLTFKEVNVPAEDVVAIEGEGAKLAEETFDRVMLGVAAEMLGVMEQGLALAIEYMKTRQQFGRPISSFQSLQHRAVNDHIEIELTRSLLYQVCTAMDEGRGHRAMVSAVKARASESVLSVTKSMVQMHGAIGFTDEYDASLYVRRAMSLAVQYGNAACHRKRFARLSAQSG